MEVARGSDVAGRAKTRAEGRSVRISRVDVTCKVLGADGIDGERVRAGRDRHIGALDVHLGRGRRDVECVPIPAQHGVSGGKPIGKFHVEGLIVVLLAIGDVCKLEPCHRNAWLINIIGKVECAFADVRRRQLIFNVEFSTRSDECVAHARIVVVAAAPVVGREDCGSIANGIILVQEVANARHRIKETAVALDRGEE